MVTKEVTLTNEVGLHARPAARLVQAAAKFKSAIRLHCNGREADAKSLLLILGLGARRGTTVTITASGEDEVQALTELDNLVQSGFGEA